MKPIDQILNRISVLFYIFAGLFVVSTVYAFIVGFCGLAGTPRAPQEHQSLVMLIAIAILGLTMIVAGVWAIVLFVRLLVSIGKSIARRNIFDLQTVRLINRYAILNGVCILLLIIFHFVEPGLYSQTEGVFMYSEMLSNAGSLAMLLMFGQVLKIGYILKQEQDLTI